MNKKILCSAWNKIEGIAALFRDFRHIEGRNHPPRQYNKSTSASLIITVCALSCKKIFQNKNK